MCLVHLRRSHSVPLGSVERAMDIIMVKKRLADGSECRKCRQMTDLLQQRGVWDRITRVVWAEEGSASSEGSQLASRHGLDTAPFYIIRADDGQETVYRSTLQMLSTCFGVTPSSYERALEHVKPTETDDLLF